MFIILVLSSTYKRASFLLTDNLIEKWVLLSVKKLRQWNLPQDVVLVGVASSRKREVCETFFGKKRIQECRWCCRQCKRWSWCTHFSPKCASPNVIWIKIIIKPSQIWACCCHYYLEWRVFEIQIDFVILFSLERGPGLEINISLFLKVSLLMALNVQIENKYRLRVF